MTDILEILVKYLHEKTGVPTSTEVPPEIPDEYISIFRDGGFRQLIRYESSTITIYAWGRDDAQAYRLMQKIRKAMMDLPKEVLEVSHVEENVISVNDLTIDNRRRYEGLFFILSTLF